jgi:3-methylcrotonyl-CoA carboxylase alpha subunit
LLPGRPDDTPWGQTNGWRLGGAREYRSVRLRHGDEERNLTVPIPPPAPEGAYLVPDGDSLHVFESGSHHVFRVVDPYLPPVESADHHGGLTAPMPGRVLAVLVSPGQEVARGAPLVVMEAMKMEHTVTAPRAGAIDKLCCSVGEQIKEGTELLILK